MKSFGLLICSLALSTQVFAADITGTYRGEFNGRKGSLTLTNTNGTYALAFMGEDGYPDIIGGACNSVIGANTEVKMKNGIVKSLAFEFSAGSCFGIEGREMFVKVKPNQLSVSVFAHNETMQNCHFDPNGRQYCDDVNWPVYADGKFTR